MCHQRGLLVASCEEGEGWASRRAQHPGVQVVCRLERRHQRPFCNDRSECTVAIELCHREHKPHGRAGAALGNTFVWICNTEYNRCCRVRCWVTFRGMGIGGGVGTGRVVCVAGVPVKRKFWTPRVMESWLPSTESNASLKRLWRALRSSASPFSCAAAPGFLRLTLAHSDVSTLS